MKQFRGKTALTCTGVRCFFKPLKYNASLIAFRNTCTNVVSCRLCITVPFWAELIIYSNIKKSIYICLSVEQFSVNWMTCFRFFSYGVSTLRVLFLNMIPSSKLQIPRIRSVDIQRNWSFSLSDSDNICLACTDFMGRCTCCVMTAYLHCQEAVMQNCVATTVCNARR